MNLRKRVDELERDVETLRDMLRVNSNGHYQMYGSLRDLVFSLADLTKRGEQEETAEYSLPTIDMTDVPPYCEIHVTMTVGRTGQPEFCYVAVDRRNQIRGTGETQAEALVDLLSRQPVVQPDERAEESPSLLDAIRANIDRQRSTYLGEGATEEVPPQPRQLAEAQYAVGQHVQVNTLGEWEDATVMSINECDVCPGTYQIATNATETCRHERDVRAVPDGTDEMEVPEVSSLARLGGPCPSCGRVVNWELVSPLTEPVEPEHTLLRIPIRAPRATGWEMPCGCRLDEWTLYTKIGPKEMLIRLTSPDGIASSEVTCPVTPMTCPMDGTEGLEE